MTNAERVCPGDFREEGPLWQSNCGPEKGWFRVAPLCKHRLSSQSPSLLRQPLTTSLLGSNATMVVSGEKSPHSEFGNLSSR